MDTVSVAPALARDGTRRAFCEVEGRRIAYVEAGRGPPVLLIHGALTNLDDMVLGPFQALARDHRVIAFDRPGHGESSRLRLADASPWRQAELINKAARELGATNPIVVGHSFGGAVALAYAMSFPQDTKGVLALAPIVWPEPRLELAAFGMRATPASGDVLAACAAGTVDLAALPLLWRAMFLPQPMPERFREGFSFDRAGAPQTTLSTGEDAFAIVTALWRSVAAYPSCRTPVRILGGDCDMVINNAVHGLALGRILPRGRFDFVQRMGHMLHHFAVDEVVAGIRALEAVDTVVA